MLYDVQVHHCTEVRLVSFFSGDLTTMAVINPPEKKLENRTSVQCSEGILVFSKMVSNESKI